MAYGLYESGVPRGFPSECIFVYLSNLSLWFSGLVLRQTKKGGTQLIVHVHTYVGTHVCFLTGVSFDAGTSAVGKITGTRLHCAHL